MKNKVIYLKSLIKDYKPKTETFPKDIIHELDKFGVELMKTKKPKDLHADKRMGRAFILRHTEEFMEHVVDYSLADRFKKILDPRNNLE